MNKTTFSGMAVGCRHSRFVNTIWALITGKHVNGLYRIVLIHEFTNYFKKIKLLTLKL